MLELLWQPTPCRRNPNHHPHLQLPQPSNPGTACAGACEGAATCASPARPRRPCQPTHRILGLGDAVGQDGGNKLVHVDVALAVQVRGSDEALQSLRVNLSSQPRLGQRASGAQRVVQLGRREMAVAVLV